MNSVAKRAAVMVLVVSWVGGWCAYAATGIWLGSSLFEVVISSAAVLVAVAIFHVFAFVVAGDVVLAIKWVVDGELP